MGSGQGQSVGSEVINWVFTTHRKSIQWGFTTQERKKEKEKEEKRRGRKRRKKVRVSAV